MTPNQPPTPEKNMTFTNQVPTVPGFYAWKPRKGFGPIAVFIQRWNTVFEVFHGTKLQGVTTDIGGFWCLLLPADECVKRDEIEKAFREALQHFPVSETTKIVLWTDSRAYKIAKGEEV